MKEIINFSSDKRLWQPSPLAGQIVLVTTVDETGLENIAPKSWISMMAFDPPLLALGCNLNHRTAQNIRLTKEFVINVPGADLVHHVWLINNLPHPRPVEAAGLTSIPSVTVKPPRVEECKAFLECRWDQELIYGMEVIFLAKIVNASIDRKAAEAGDPYGTLRPIFFLEGSTYGIIERSHHV